MVGTVVATRAGAQAVGNYACLMLPFPPSVNNLFVNNPATRGRFPSAQYKAWQVAADCHLRAQAPLPHFDGPVIVTLSYGRPDRRKRDLANLEKATTDQIVKAGVLTDDSLIEKLTMQWVSDVQGCRIEIESITA